MADGGAGADAAPYCGIVLTTHKDHWTTVLRACLESIVAHAPRPLLLCLMGNETAPSIETQARELCAGHERLELRFKRYATQEGGLTRTWNDGLATAIAAGCGSIMLLNHDTVLDRNCVHLFREALSFNGLVGPVSDNPGVAPPFKAQTLERYDRAEAARGRSVVADYPVEGPRGLNGFCMTASAATWRANMFDATLYFNPAFPWGWNECDWNERFARRLGAAAKFRVVRTALVMHSKRADWRKIDPDYMARRHKGAGGK